VVGCPLEEKGKEKVRKGESGKKSHVSKNSSPIIQFFQLSKKIF